MQMKGPKTHTEPKLMDVFNSNIITSPNYSMCTNKCEKLIASMQCKFVHIEMWTISDCTMTSRVITSRDVWDNVLMTMF